MAIFPYFMQWKCHYVGGWMVQKSLKTPLRNTKMALNPTWKNILTIPELSWIILNIIVVFLQTSTRNFARSPPAKRAIHSRLSAASNTAASNDGKRASNQASNKVRLSSRIEFQVMHFRLKWCIIVSLLCKLGIQTKAIGFNGQIFCIFWHLNTFCWQN